MSKIQDYLSKILSARYGKDVRQSIHDAIHQCYEDGKAGAVDLIAREELETKVNKTDFSTPFNFKGSCLSTELPESGEVNDTYYCTDLKYRMTWNGTEWYQSSLSESEYEEELSGLKSNITQVKSDFLKIQDVEWINGYFAAWGEYKSPDSVYQEKYCEVPAVKGNEILFEYGFNEYHDEATCTIFEYNAAGQHITSGDTTVPIVDDKNYKRKYTVSNSETAYILIQFRTFGDNLYKNVYITDYAPFDYVKAIETTLLERINYLENLLIQIKDKLNQGTVVDNITVNEINDMIVEYLENKTVSEVEG